LLKQTITFSKEELWILILIIISTSFLRLWDLGSTKFNHEDSLKPQITDKNITDYHDPQGQIYTIVGTAGALDVHNFTRPAAPYTAVQFNVFGFINISVLHNGTILVGNFYENDGTIRDHFAIDKSTDIHRQRN
jgi:hypothetical protein